MNFRKIVLSQAGAANAMTVTDLSPAERAALEVPQAGEVVVRHHAVGLNYIDIYHRSGVYPMAVPTGLGMEGAGVVEGVGAGVTHLKAGDRVAYASTPPGSYCDVRVMPAKNVCLIPDGISFQTGAAMMLKGFTAQYLLRRTLPQGGLQAGDFVLFHAAAGGVGLLACQIARALGYNMIATAGSDEKCTLALQYGATHAINYKTQDFAAEVKTITGGRGVKVVYDSVGKDTFEGSLNCLSPLGLMVSYGNASGKVPPVDIGVLGAKGSLHLTRPTVFTHLATRESTQAMADELFGMVLGGKLNVPISKRYALTDVVQAHTDLEARSTTGALILIP